MLCPSIWILLALQSGANRRGAEFSTIQSYKLFPPGPEDESDLNYTPQTTFRLYPTGFVPSHPGGGGVECTVQMADRFKY